MNISLMNALGMMGGGNRLRRVFSARYSQPQSTLVTSNKAYPKDIPTDAAITVSAGAEYSLDGGAWTAVAGTWGTSKYVQCRGSSNASYGLAVIHTVTIGLLELDFTIWTMEDPAFGPLWNDSETWQDNLIWTE